MIVLLCPKCKSSDIDYIQDYQLNENGSITLNAPYTNVHLNKLCCNKCNEIFELNQASTISR